MTTDRPTTEPRWDKPQCMEPVGPCRLTLGHDGKHQAEAAQGAAPLTDWEKSQLPRHTEDGHGGCIVCREWDGTFGEDDEMTTTIVSWPCAKVRLAAQGAAPEPVSLPTNSAQTTTEPQALRALVEILGEPDHAEQCKHGVSEAGCIIEGLYERGFTIKAQGPAPRSEGPHLHSTVGELIACHTRTFEGAAPRVEGQRVGINGRHIHAAGITDMERCEECRRAAPRAEGPTYLPSRKHGQFAATEAHEERHDRECPCSAPRAEGLDYEALYRAIEDVTEEWDDMNSEPSVVFAGSQHDLKDRIIAAYVDRLSRPSDERVTEPRLDTTARENWADAVAVLRDSLDVQRTGCDHEGIGKPGCRTCDPRTRAYGESEEPR